MCVWNIVVVFFSSLPCTIYCKYHELKLGGDLVNMDIDNITNDIFIGGDNILLKLSPHLEEIKRLPTGPVLDYIDCPGEGDCEGRNVTNNNKALLLHYHNSTKHLLLTCGSIKHGVCQMRNVDSLLDESRSKEFVVSNAPQPAVVLITPWDEPAKQKRALYVGTSWDQRYDGPKLRLLDGHSVSTRNIDGNDIFKVSEINNIEGSSSLMFENGNLHYLVKFIYGFSSGDFNYFVTVQETTESFDDNLGKEVLKTFIIRICQQDIHYKTYIELPVECHLSGKKYNRAKSGYVTKRGDLYSKSSRLQASDDVLIVTFSEGTAQTSAICLYPVKELNEAMASEQQKCVNGTYQGLTLGLPWTLGGDKKCEKEDSLRITPEYCPKQFPEHFPHPYRGKKSLDKQAILEYSKGLLTAVTAMPYYNHTVMFLGTDKGKLLKASVQDVSQKVEPYRELSIGVKEVRQIKLTGDYKYLVVLSADKVTKVPVEECSLSSTCSECVQLKDPFCGWCTLYKKCSQIQYCHQVEVHPLKFVSDESKCVKFASISPEIIPYDGSVVQINISVSNLPPSNSYKCFIDKKERPTEVFDQDLLQCSSPDKNDLPSISSDTGDVFVDLDLFSNESNTVFISRRLGFYSCSAARGCRHCAEGNYDCNWCTYLGKCTSDGAADCPGEFIWPVQKRTTSPTGCPRLKANVTLLIPVDVKTNVTIPGQDFPQPKAGASYKCKLLGETVDAALTSPSELVCKPKMYSYIANVDRKPVNLTVTFGNQEQLYIPDTFKVYLSKCWVSRTDCSTCHSDVKGEPGLRCGWCKAGTPRCVVKEGCSEANDWIPFTSPCLTTPNITKVWPLAGPLVGGTEVQIDGYDLGKEFADISNSVTVADHPCYSTHNKYKPSKRIFCNTSASSEDKSGPVVVTVNQLEGKSAQIFNYQNPEPQDFYPKKGPESGGTNVTITGLKMNTGRVIAVQVAGRPCEVNRTRVTDTSVSCVTGHPQDRKRRMANRSTGVIISFDGFTPDGPMGSFSYTPDPTVTAIEPERIFFGGGLELEITGTHLDSIQKPKITIKYPSGSGTRLTDIQVCKVIRSSLMICRAPPIPVITGNVSQVVASFILDGVNFESNNTKLTLIPNPDFKKFPDDYVLQGASLILQATNLEDTLRNQIYVTVGGLQCNITSIDKNQLVCLAPLEKDHKTKPADGLYAVKVDVGYLSFPIGMLKYYKVETDEIPLIVWIGVAAGIALAVIIFIVVLCWCRRSRRKQKKHFKSLEVQMNNLESKVARECREAFAELQTDVTDLTSDLSTSGMPILDFKTYALHVLFPGLNDHPVLNKNKALLGENWEKGLRQFSQLICNKKFLLVFIRTLESQPTFQMKDRCNVASLLMVALQAKMEYATEILKDLLCELIRKSVAKSHPKLLLRRTESVAEKMLTNWLAFCMYHFLKNDAGEPLFMLFKAVKQQAEKGPVDAVTGEARYSLSEDKLLRQAVDFKPVGVSVSYNGSPAVAVVLLDCDTISQAKDKILDVVFKNSPFSSRPLIDDLRLEWDQSSGRVLSLRDDDSQSVIEGEWRKINTLRHYQVTDNASLRLVTGQTYFYSSTDSELNKKNVRLDIRVGFSPGGSYSPLAFGTTDGPDEGGRLWHLVKQLDYPTDRADDDRNSKFVSEIYLTRLLKTKGTIQQFVDRLFHTVFMMNRRGGSGLPPVIKFLFDLLDAQAKELNLTDPEVLHTWKNNSLPLRFWINIIKNPNFIFDVCKSTIVDSCLSVIAQLFMDSCSVSEQVLDKDSPSNKLLYAREIPGYRQEVERFYADIQASPAPTPQELSRFFTDLSTEHGHEFNADHALQELYDYVKRYQDQLQEALEDSELSSLASKLEHVIATISDD